MKKTILFLVMAVALTTQTLFAQVPSYVPSNGLVGYWPFNGNANDVSGNGNNGTVNGSVQLTTDRFGISNSSYLFPGNSDSYISVPSSQTLKIQTEITISAWILMDGGYNNPRIIQFGNYVNSGYSLFVNGDSNVSRTLTGLITNVGGLGVGLSSELNSLVWNHVCFVANSNGSGKLYINGVIVSTVDGTVPNNVSYIGALNIGRMDHPAYDAWGGKLDDIGIWNRALTQQEITTMYNSIEVPTYSDTCNAVSGSLTQGLVGYWPFCGNANDDSGNGNNGTVNGATLTTDRFGNSNSAYSFNGVSNTISYNSTFVFNQNSDGALSFWFENESILSNIYSTLFFSKTTLGENNRFNLYLQPLPDNLLRFTLDYRESNSNLHILNTLQPITNNIWNNLIISRSLNVYSLYLNGILVGTVTDTTPNLPNEIGWLIGSNPNGFGVPIFYQGKIDDIGFWNRALTSSEVTQLYNQNQCFTNTTVTDTLIINVGQLSYTNPIAYANNIIIAPNPASTQININFNNITDLNGGTLKVINSLGQEVATTPITTSGTNSTMQLATWGGTGMYFVQIINPQGQIVDIKKIILQ
jgi:hypothetical protein